MTNSLSLSDWRMSGAESNLKFKKCLKHYIKPKCHKFFSKDSKLGCALATQLRLGRTKLNSHLYTIGLSNISSLCHNPHETTSHYLLDCFLYQNERQTLFGIMEQFFS